ncbi:MAG TPA: class I SAM-dependent methyltransferase [Bacteroidales bacterium]|jgi:2-polyprenyl-3-methyl-5-hydroxy-6-metoxy-1,4-benzoquinol methylase|nr:class I SAM-dependent methyltransferase [Bacteroidales bacterium]MDI9573094.1 class I SAM-dependent methyltransferase [Bacteroidota bacterium]HOE58892.1 class I SAM-dependent methyltransferase [Bacteroidales bacterium]HOR04720.1 class I SAM-dependent methyltransferase [Bacteroidales bacterium]HOU34615.1 class I SAM-dependent methyltransferase [Bacteroidales bacterium]
MQYVICPICKNEKVNRILVTKDFFLSNEEFEIWECEFCKIRFTQPIPSEEKIQDYYKKEEYFSHYKNKKSLSYYIYNIARKINLRRKYKFISKDLQLKIGRVLDVGCGSGDFLNYLFSKGWDCAGVEPDNDSRHYLTKMNKFPVYSSLNEIESANSFNLITFWHVLEHIHHPEDAIQKIINLLNKEGILLIAVPNYDSPDAEFFMSYWAAWDVPRHLFHFNLLSLSKLLKINNLQVIKHSGLYFDVLYISYLSQKYLNKLIPCITGSFIGFRLMLKSKTMSNPSSIIVVAKKQ